MTALTHYNNGNAVDAGGWEMTVLATLMKRCDQGPFADADWQLIKATRWNSDIDEHALGAALAAGLTVLVPAAFALSVAGAAAVAGLETAGQKLQQPGDKPMKLRDRFRTAIGQTGAASLNELQTQAGTVLLPFLPPDIANWADDVVKNAAEEVLQRRAKELGEVYDAVEVAQGQAPGKQARYTAAIDQARRWGQDAGLTAAPVTAAELAAREFEIHQRRQAGDSAVLENHLSIPIDGDQLIRLAATLLFPRTPNDAGWMRLVPVWPLRRPFNDQMEWQAADLWDEVTQTDWAITNAKYKAAALNIARQEVDDFAQGIYIRFHDQLERSYLDAFICATNPHDQYLPPTYWDSIISKKLLDEYGALIKHGDHEMPGNDGVLDHQPNEGDPAAVNDVDFDLHRLAVYAQQKVGGVVAETMVLDTWDDHDVKSIIAAAQTWLSECLPGWLLQSHEQPRTRKRKWEGVIATECLKQLRATDALETLTRQATARKAAANIAERSFYLALNDLGMFSPD